MREITKEIYMYPCAYDLRTGIITSSPEPISKEVSVVIDGPKCGKCSYFCWRTNRCTLFAGADVSTSRCDDCISEFG